MTLYDDMLKEHPFDMRWERLKLAISEWWWRWFHASCGEIISEQEQRIIELEDTVKRLRGELRGASAAARAAEPTHGWGTKSLINDAWADGFRTAAVQISDSIREAAAAAKGE